MTGVLRIATRRSALALWQARHVQELLTERHPGLQVELVPMTTRGDRILDQPLAAIGGKGLFLKELEAAMLNGDADLAVHSMKDMPAEDTEGLTLEVALPRANPFDALVSGEGQRLESLPPGSRVGTSSLRRQCQLLARRPDLRVESLRGNVDTRLRKLQEGRYEAIILACAGLERLGLEAHVTQTLQPPDWLPAATQGIIGLQCRADDDATQALIRPLDDAHSKAQASAERAVVQLLQGSCQVPLAVFAQLDDEAIRVEGLIGSPDGARILRANATGTAGTAEAAGREVADRLIDQGALDIIAKIR